MKKILKEWLSETIVTKRKQKKEIFRLADELEKTKNELKEAKENEKDSIKLMNQYKKQFSEEHKKLNKTIRELKQLKKEMGK